MGCPRAVRNSGFSARVAAGLRAENPEFGACGVLSFAYFSLDKQRKVRTPVKAEISGGLADFKTYLEGNYKMEIRDHNASYVSTTMNTVQGQATTLTFDLERRGTISGSVAVVVINPANNGTLASQMVSASGLTQLTLNFTPPGTTVELRLYNPGDYALIENLHLKYDRVVYHTVCDNSKDYRYGFNGQEKDNEKAGLGNTMIFKYRVQDTRLGRFLSLDPLSPQYPFYSPYHFSGNRPIDMVDVEGKEPKSYEEGDGTLLYGIGVGFYNSFIAFPYNSLDHFTRSGPVGLFDYWNELLDDASMATATDMINSKQSGEFASGTQYVWARFTTPNALGQMIGGSLGVGLYIKTGVPRPAPRAPSIFSVKATSITGKTIRASSIRFSQKTVNDYLRVKKAIMSGDYTPADVVKMKDGIHTAVDNTRLLVSQKERIDIKIDIHAYDEALPIKMVQERRFIHPQTGEVAKTWGQAVEFRTLDQGGAFAKTYGGTGTFVQPKINNMGPPAPAPAITQ